MRPNIISNGFELPFAMCNSEFFPAAYFPFVTHDPLFGPEFDFILA
jgi:hypothetical protein